MFTRRTLPVWIGLCLLSGIFLMGQQGLWFGLCTENTHCSTIEYCSKSIGQCDAVGQCLPMPTVCSPAWTPVCGCDGVTYQNACSAHMAGASISYDGECYQSNLPQTGITKCYNMTRQIPCPAPGQRFYGQDAHFIINPMSYTDNGDGTVTDNVTGLIWQQCSAGLSGPACSDGTPMRMNWDDSIAYCEGLNFAGHTDWRLPDEHELQSLVDYSIPYPGPKIDPVNFPGTIPSQDDYYWSSSTYAPWPPWMNRAWHVWFSSGVVHYQRYKTEPGLVRCVRGQIMPPSFTDNLDGTVTDNRTGLIWQQEDDGIIRHWEEGLGYCQDLDLGGATDWRLPDVKELRSIVDNTGYDPAIDPVFAETKLEYYWSSSTVDGGSYYAWCSHFYDGFVSNGCLKTSFYPVRCVR